VWALLGFLAQNSRFNIDASKTGLGTNDLRPFVHGQQGIATEQERCKSIDHFSIKPDKQV
jgi:hypothetical protein